ncbi:MAG: c-type cytochrome biogenesis protein CcmI [Porticoccaceae bacterium]|nr:c-type cytochrome biogenesis protein CcmI [Porticoccaceae bacterium]MDG2116237.1 c-type cytochrome biogenesis protein CcmI [Porticoccaceae bacterium]
MTFWMMFALLLLAASGFIAFPFLSNWRRSGKNASAGVSVERTNVAIYREQQEQFQRQLDNAEISVEQFEQLSADAKQLLLSNTASQSADSPQQDNTGLWLLPVLVVLLTASSWLLYSELGAQADEDILQLITAGAEVSDNTEAAQLWRQQLNSAIATRVEQRPNNIYYWVMLAQSAIAEGELLQASNYFAAAIKAQPDDGYLLAQYAETLYLVAGSQFTPAVVEAMDKAFAVDSNNATVLGLKGIQAFEQRQLALAISYWQGARQSLDPAGSTAKALLIGIERAKMLLADGGTVTQTGEKGSIKIEVSVTIDDSIDYTPDQQVFVAVVEAAGPPMPIAARKLRAADLPVTLSLTAADELMVGRTLASAQAVRLVARLSTSGSATAQSGDWETTSPIVDVPHDQGPIELVIHRQRP